MKKLLALLLTLCLVIGMVPLAASAEGEGTDGQVNDPSSAKASVKFSEVSTKYYDTLANAVKAATAEGVSQESPITITLLKNEENGVGIVVGEGKNLVIDFGNKTYTVTGSTVGSSGTDTQCFQLLRNSTIVMENGSIIANTATA